MASLFKGIDIKVDAIGGAIGETRGNDLPGEADDLIGRTLLRELRRRAQEH
jgi:hypothetical protein